MEGIIQDPRNQPSVLGVTDLCESRNPPILYGVRRGTSSAVFLFSLSSSFSLLSPASLQPIYVLMFQTSGSLDLLQFIVLGLQVNLNLRLFITYQSLSPGFFFFFFSRWKWRLKTKKSYKPSGDGKRVRSTRRIKS